MSLFKLIGNRPMEQCRRMIVKMLKITIQDEIHACEDIASKTNEVAQLVEIARLENKLINQLQTLEEL